VLPPFPNQKQNATAFHKTVLMRLLWWEDFAGELSIAVPNRRFGTGASEG
jgi:hypothetical protein